ncbi:hypothetical protein [Jiella marina]|uniref:hypothetical protein n=1 Tax=Jiella sp. LLJ827 TaxID=2917712 RepID=UPI0021014A99|nr:hypothetical protein [Jiella sp. LLJ827]MCQ0989255.1 hypothetical protein [Jiella sp. LLJ827]
MSQVLDEVSWLAGEVFRNVPKAKLPDNISLPNTRSAFEKLISDVGTEFVDDASNIVDALASDLADWASDPKALEEKAFTELVETVIEPIILDIVKLTNTVIDDGIDVLEGGKKDLANLVDWLDTEIELPFFTAFYDNFENVIVDDSDNLLSLLDLSLLLMSIPATKALGDLTGTFALDQETADGAAGEIPDIAIAANVLLGAAGLLTFLYDLIGLNIDAFFEDEDSELGPALDLGENIVLVLASLFASIVGTVASEQEDDLTEIELATYWIASLSRDLINLLIVSAGAGILALTRGQNAKLINLGVSIMFFLVSLLFVVIRPIAAATEAARIKGQADPNERAEATYANVVEWLGVTGEFLNVGRPIIAKTIGTIGFKGVAESVAVESVIILFSFLRGLVTGTTVAVDLLVVDQSQEAENDGRGAARRA